MSRAAGIIVTLGLAAAGARAAPVTATQPPDSDDVLRHPELVAPWLRPWLPATRERPMPDLASGTEASIGLAAGTIVSSFSPWSAAITEIGEYGHYVTSSPRQALSIEAIETLNVVLDDVTPQFGLLGAGLRRVGRQNGHGLAALNIERASLGLAVEWNGGQLATGLGAELAWGILDSGGDGWCIHAGGYFFGPPDGANKLFVVGIGYVFSPVIGTRAAPPELQPAALAAPRTHAAHPCPDLASYEDALASARRDAVAACNAERMLDCKTKRDRVLVLRARMNACLDGEDVGPAEPGDAP